MNFTDISKGHIPHPWSSELTICRAYSDTKNWPSIWDVRQLIPKTEALTVSLNTPWYPLSRTHDSVGPSKPFNIFRFLSNSITEPTRPHAPEVFVHAAALSTPYAFQVNLTFSTSSAQRWRQEQWCSVRPPAPMGPPLFIFSFLFLLFLFFLSIMLGFCLFWGASFRCGAPLAAGPWVRA